MDDLATWIAATAADGRRGLRAELGDDRVLRVVLDRPPGNRMSWRMLVALRELGEALREPGDVRVVLLGHAGDDFCHGADLGDDELVHHTVAGHEARLELARAGAAMIRDLATGPVPVVVGAEGKAIGGGAGLWLAAHFRVASSRATVCFPEVDRGMHLSWGLVALAAHEAGPSWARRLALGGQAVAVTALGAGLARIVEPGEVAAAAERLAGELAAKPPLAVRAILEVDNRGRRHALGRAHDDAEVFADTVESQDFAEAMAAFFEKRPGVFEGR